VNLVLAAAGPSLFLMTYFVGNGESGAYLAISQDGYRFVPLVNPNRPILAPTLGKDRLMRDPSVVQGPDGRWHMVWTTGWWDRSIGLASSDDLANWGPQRNVPVMESVEGAINSWAPEIAFNPGRKEFVIVWSTTIKGRYPETSRPDGDLSPDRTPLNHRFYQTTSRDLATFSPTRLLWEPGFNVIDATLNWDGDRWVVFAKDETKSPQAHKWLFAATAAPGLNRFEIVAPRITGNYWAEGPTAAKVGDRWRVYFDRYTEGRWGAVESRDLRNWSDVSDRVELPKGARHGTVFRATPLEVERVRAALARRAAAN